MRRTEIARTEPKIQEQDQTEKISWKQDKKRKTETWNNFMKDEKIVIILNLLDYVNDSPILTVE